MTQAANNFDSPVVELPSFGKVAIKLGFVNQAQIEEAVKVQNTAAKAGLRLRLGEILIKKGYLSTDQFREILKGQTTGRKRVGPFELISKLGEGGMGSVFKAREVFIDRPIALKILSNKMAKNMEFQKRFVREAQAVAKLNHPHIVAGFDVGSADGYCYFAMEYVDGESLGHYLHRKGGKLEEREALEFMRQIALALDHAHKHDMIHRDVKPDNILLDKTYQTAKLADLGLVRSADSADDDAALTHAGQAIGTPFYISPEQARGMADLTPATDLYSLGASLFHLLTGQLPFEGLTAAVIMTRHVTDPVPSPRQKNPEVSVSADRIVMKLMQKNPGDRYSSAMTLAHDLSRILKGQMIGIDEKVIAILPLMPGNSIANAHSLPVSSTRYPSGSRSKRFRRQTNEILIILLVIATIMLLAGVAYLVFRAPVKSPPQRKLVGMSVNVPQASRPLFSHNPMTVGATLPPSTQFGEFI